MMEHISGQPLTDYCNSHKLNTKERLQLFRTICSAVQYAHQNLVVHRDLKPANILVTVDGIPKLLDFGIAKLLNPDVFGGDSAPTAMDVRVMTPEYASPEQVRGEPIATSSDIYSLGIILYELLAAGVLTGSRATTRWKCTGLSASRSRQTEHRRHKETGGNHRPAERFMEAPPKNSRRSCAGILTTSF